MAKEKEFTFDEGDDDFSPDPYPTPPIKPPSGGGQKRTLLLLLLLVLMGGAGGYFYLYGIPGMESAPPTPTPVAVKVPVAPAPKPPAPVAVAPKPVAPAPAPVATAKPVSPAPAPVVAAPAKPVAAPAPVPTQTAAAPVKAVPAPASVAAAQPAAKAASPVAPVPPPPAAAASSAKMAAKPQPGSFVLNAGAFMVKANLVDAERRIRRLGFEPRRAIVKRPAEMTRLRVGVYPRPEAEARYRDLVARYPSAFTLKQGDKVALYVASYHNLNQARSFADELYLDGIHVDEEQVQVPMRMTVVTFGDFTDKAAAEKELKRVRAMGLHDVTVTVTK